MRIHTGTAFVTMVALDKYGKPTEVPALILEKMMIKYDFNKVKQEWFLV